MDSVNSILLRKQAFDLLRQGDASGSIDRLTQIVASFPEDDQSWTYLGAAYSNLKKWELATRAFQRVVELRPSCRARYNLGLAWERTGRLDEAEKQFAQAFEIEPTYEPAIEGLSRIRKALAPSSMPKLAPQEYLPKEAPSKTWKSSERLIKSGLVYGTGIGAVWYVAVFFFLQLFGLGFGSVLLRFAQGGRLFLLVAILALIGAAIGAAIGYIVGYANGGQATGLRVGAAAGMIAEPLNALVVGGASGRLLFVSAGVGLVMGAIVGAMIGRLVELSQLSTNNVSRQLMRR